MKRKHKRLTFVIVAMALVGVATGLVLYALGDGVSLFHSPTDIVTKAPDPNQSLRLGGLVEEGSVQRAEGSSSVHFRVTDLENSVDVVYEGLLPDLFREGQGIVTTGKVVNGTFIAEEVLAKHDENYMPPEAVDALKKSGQWQGDAQNANTGAAK
ncbi:cytochrome c maturation protein CcmE [Magnetovibrio blakemorei]|uniref:Cytochrome c-type biogenesis protein CcmE n=1 Tax=Magnetovibrio blakemorei TaxID=28181 RepID=A0A1E5QCA0_9PROT|nr:cytochrome c maturation protein CcmE [Magnetovibrio blakemorei]OEJ69683.1 cytochrome c biogenesis protein CcmE [Magnetovibrio blakemorei]